MKHLKNFKAVFLILMLVAIVLMSTSAQRSKKTDLPTIPETFIISESQFTQHPYELEWETYNQPQIGFFSNDLLSVVGPGKEIVMHYLIQNELQFKEELDIHDNKINVLYGNAVCLNNQNEYTIRLWYNSSNPGKKYISLTNKQHYFTISYLVKTDQQWNRQYARR